MLSALYIILDDVINVDCIYSILTPIVILKNQKLFLNDRMGEKMKNV